MTKPDRGRRWKAELIPFDAVSVLSSEDKHCYKLSERTVAILLSQTNYLYWQTRWSKDGEFSDGEKALIRDMASEVEHELLLADQCEECFDYRLSSSIVEIAPTDPYVDPGEIPDGYLSPPWQILTGGTIGTSLAAGDMLANAPIASTDYPRIRVNVSGDVLVQIEYVPIPNGGMMQIQADGDILSLRYVDMNADIVSIPPEVEPELTVDHKFEGVGDHFLDITILPRVDDSLEAVGIGGALRKVTVCGQIQECIDMPFNVRQNEDDPCELDKSTDDGATWDAWANLRLCPPVLIQLGGGVVGVVMPDDTVVPTPTGDPTYDGREHAPPPAPRGGSETDNKCTAAANAVNTLLALHATVARLISVPDALTIAVAVAGLLISLLFIPIAVGIIVAIIAGGAMTIFAALTYGDFDSTVQHDLQCILDCNATDTDGVVTFNFDAVKSAVGDNIEALNIWAAIDKYLDIIGESGLNLAGATTAITSADCSDCGCEEPDTWSKTWDWQTTDYSGETDTTISIGAWVSGQGIESADVPADHNYASSEFVVVGHWSAGNEPTTIDHYEMDVYRPASGSDQDIQIGAVTYIHPLSGTGEIHVSGDGSFYDHSTENTTTHTFQNFTSNGPGSKPTMYLRRLKLSGTGHCPFANPD